ncbi:LppU/SCO3897 family protein [Saccharothrix syringae]|uniref:Secreted protein n=1 Tax=Saccharothrix syringae TaxID=103733 RepID=A0A5Q0GRB9_SACSY|nr:hypothetical protein [Saccharothrix syringae]QFZ16463.1 hypothetical protein EKG83_02395 [Saccharothrix syringae]
MRRKIRWGIAAAAVLAAFAFAMPLISGGGTAEPGGPAAGSCAQVEGAGHDATFRTADCAADVANVKVAKVVTETTQCPSGAPYTTFTSKTVLCLIPNFVEGACYVRDARTGLRKVDCSTGGSIRVLKVAPGIASCGDGPTVRYPEPQVTFCLSRPL